jgi:hypothetical protein
MYSDTITANPESLEETGRNKVDINQPSLGLVYQGLVEDLAKIHLQAYKVFG